MSEEQNAEATPKSKPVRHRRGRPWLMVVLGAVILLSGIVIGSGLTLLWLQNKLLYMLHHPDDAPKVLALHLKSKLGLSDDQTKQVEAVLRERQKHTKALRHEYQPRIEEQLLKARDEVAKVLTAEQAEEWQSYFNDMKEKWIPPPPPAAPVEKDKEP